MQPNISRQSRSEAHLHLITPDRRPAERRLLDAGVQILRPDADRPPDPRGALTLDGGRDRDDGLDAARGIAFGTVLGMICWIPIGVVVYLISR